MSFGSQIKTARKAVGKTQQHVAQHLGVSVQAVSQWETDRTLPTASVLFKLANFIKMRLDAPTNVTEVVAPFAYASIDRQAVAAPLVGWENPSEWAALELEEDEDKAFFGGYSTYYDVGWKPVGNVYALLVDRDGMAPTFQRGDIVILDTGRAPEPNDFVIAHMEGRSRVVFGRYIPVGIDEHRAVIFELHYEDTRNLNPTRIDSDHPGNVIGVIREHRRYYRRD